MTFELVAVCSTREIACDYGLAKTIAFSALDQCISWLHPVTVPLVAIVDDDEALCASLVDTIRASRYCAEAFSSAEELLTSVKLLDFDCIVADVQMTGINGFELVTTLVTRHCPTPVILITALPDSYLDDHALRVGAHCLLRKPFDTSDLLQCIERTLP